MVVRYSSYLLDSVNMLSGSSIGYHKQSLAMTKVLERSKVINYIMDDALDPTYHSAWAVIECRHRTTHGEGVPGCICLSVRTVKPLVYQTRWFPEQARVGISVEPPGPNGGDRRSSYSA